MLAVWFFCWQSQSSDCWESHTSNESEDTIQWIDDQTLELAAVFITLQLMHSDISITKIVIRLFFDFRMNSIVYIQMKYVWALKTDTKK